MEGPLETGTPRKSLAGDQTATPPPSDAHADLSHLKALATSLDGALAAVAENAASARVDLDRAVARCRSGEGPESPRLAAAASALLDGIDAAEARKRSLLETERVTVDNALEAAMHAVDTFAAPDVARRLAEICAHIPRSPIEPTTIKIIPSPADQHLSPPVILVTPPAIWPSEVAIDAFAAHAHRGSPWSFLLALRLGHAAHSEHAWSQMAALESLLAHLCVRISIFVYNALGDSSIPTRSRFADLDVLLSPEPGLRCGVRVRVDVPPDTPIGALLRVSHISVSGLPVPLASDTEGLTARVCSMVAPLRLPRSTRYGYHTPAIACDGTLYAPMDGADCVASFAWDGSPLPPLRLGLMGLRSHVKVAVAVCGCSRSEARRATDATPDDFHVGGDCVVFADTEANSRIVALRSSPGKVPGHEDVMWRVQTDVTVGMAALPTDGILVVGARYQSMLRAYALAAQGGPTVEGESAPSMYRYVVYVAADAASGLVFASQEDCVVALRWDATARALVGADLPQPRPSLAMAANQVLPRKDAYRPLAVVPGTPAHLVIGTYLSGDLVVAELPSCAVVHRHRLSDVQVTGLAADPAGTVLAVCDQASGAILVLPWPLPEASPA